MLEVTILFKLDTFRIALQLVKTFRFSKTLQRQFGPFQTLIDQRTIGDSTVGIVDLRFVFERLDELILDVLE